MEMSVDEISQRISQLETLMGDDLRNEMSALKQAILENPSACSLLLDQDIGKLVSSLRRITGQAIASAAAKATKPKAEPKAKPAKLTAAELAAALDDEDF